MIFNERYVFCAVVVLVAINTWSLLPVANAAWRPTHRVRAVTSDNNVDPRAQEVLELPSIDLAAAQDEDPDLLFVKDLLHGHDSRPRWDSVWEESAEVKILWTQFHQFRCQKMYFTARGKRQLTINNGRWWLPRKLDHRSSKHAIITV